MNNKILNRRRKVATYLRRPSVCIEPLRFGNVYSHTKYNGIELDDQFDVEVLPLEDIISNVILLSRRYASYNAITDKVETASGKKRSVIDIWRHIRYYHPNISIFQVMRKMKNVSGICGNYCPWVHRYVFNIYSRRNIVPARTEFGISVNSYDKV